MWFMTYMTLIKYKHYYINLGGRLSYFQYKKPIIIIKRLRDKLSVSIDYRNFKYYGMTFVSDLEAKSFRIGQISDFVQLTFRILKS